MSKPALTVGTIGHAGDGKTSLLSAITHVLAGEPGCSATPRTVAELDRISGVPPLPTQPRWLYGTGTIQRSAVPYESASRRYAHIDAPGRRAMIGTAARGVSIIDAAIVVVSAEDGVRAQTREHVLMARCAGVRHFIVFINKCDVADSTAVDVVELEVRRMLADYGLDGDDIRVVRGSATAALDGEPWRSAIVALIGALDSDVPLPERDPDGAALFRIDELFGRGLRQSTLAAGRVERGTIASGEWFDCLGYQPPARAKVESVEIFRSGVMSAGAGEQIGVLLSGPPGRSYRRGQVLVLSKSATAGVRFTADITLLTQDRGGRHTPIFSGHRAHFHMGAAAVTGTITWEGPAGLAPGEAGRVDVELDLPVHLELGMGLFFRDGCDGFQRKFGGAPRWSGTAGVGEVAGIDHQGAGR